MADFSVSVWTRRRALAVLASGLPTAYFATKIVNNRSPIPFLVTADVHQQPDLYDRLNRCLDCLSRADMKATLFFPGILATSTGMSRIFQRMLSEGHQIACHGLLHDDSEDYHTGALEVQRRNLRRAKQLLEQTSGASVTAFRAPEFRISKYTLTVLDTLGFEADLSVCSQRLSLISSQIGNYHWLFSPREPYHPKDTNPYARGNLKLLEIPTSAALVPLMSALNRVSVTASEGITIVLKYEALLVSKPIVYQCHPEDFIFLEQAAQPMSLSWRSLIPTRHGIPVRWALETTDGRIAFKKNEEFLEFVTGTKAFQFLTVDEYISRRAETINQ